MKIFTGKLFFALVFAAVCAHGLRAQSEAPNVYQAFRRGVSFTAFDLMKKVFPEIRIDEKNSRDARTTAPVGFRHLFGAYAKKIYPPDTKIVFGETLETVNGSERILWVLFNIVEPREADCANCGAAILAAFRISRTNAELIDAADIKTNDWTSADDLHPILKLSPRREAVVFRNTSGLSQMVSNTFSIIATGENGFVVLLEEFDEHLDYRCARFFNETASLRLLKTGVRGYRSLEIRLKVESGVGDSDYSETDTRRRFRYVFAWQPRRRKYVPVINPDRRRRALLERLEPCRF